MCQITGYAKLKQVILERLIKLDDILLAESSDCHHPTSNQIGPIQLFLSLSLSLHCSTQLPPSPLSSYYCELDIEDANM